MSLDRTTGLPRFNMAFELGLFLAAKRFGSGRQRRKVALILDKSRYHYRAALSDISGHDIARHNQIDKRAIREVRDWLDSFDPKRSLPGGDYISRQYNKFGGQLPAASKKFRLNAKRLTFPDICRAIKARLKDNA